MGVRTGISTAARLARLLLACACAVASAATCAQAQISGNAAFQQNGGKAKAEQEERADHVLTAQDLPPTSTSMFVDADILMNVKADEYVAVFGLAQDADTADEAAQKMDALVRQFTDSLKPLRVRDTDIYVDFIMQPRVYGYELTDNVAREKLVGFDLKKNISIHYSDRNLIDRLVAAAAKAHIYDLIKVDYVVKDINAVQTSLMVEAATVIKQKIAQDEKLLGIKIEPPAEVYAQRSAIHYPTSLYDAYTAAESESIRLPNLQKYSVLQARKERTFYFNALDGSSFDKIVNPVVVEPVIQFTLYLKVKYEVVR
jgi:uncharacterized protein YggE